MLLYQDFNEQFEGYTQRGSWLAINLEGCFIRISMSNLKDIHNRLIRQAIELQLLYQDFNEQFEGYTQPLLGNYLRQPCCFIRISMSNLKDIHNTITTDEKVTVLLYQDFNEQFEGYTQLEEEEKKKAQGCFIRISMSNLKDIHNKRLRWRMVQVVALSGFQ